MPRGSTQDQVAGLHGQQPKPLSGGGVGADVGVRLWVRGRARSPHHLTENASQARIATLTLQTGTLGANHAHYGGEGDCPLPPEHGGR